MLLKQCVSLVVFRCGFIRSGAFRCYQCVTRWKRSRLMFARRSHTIHTFGRQSDNRQYYYTIQRCDCAHQQYNVCIVSLFRTRFGILSGGVNVNALCDADALVSVRVRGWRYVRDSLLLNASRVSHMYMSCINRYRSCFSGDYCTSESFADTPINYLA